MALIALSAEVTAASLLSVGISEIPRLKLKIARIDIQMPGLRVSGI